MEANLALVAILIVVSVIHPSFEYFIEQIDVAVADCPNCDMDVSGDLSVKICGPDGCCTAKYLDNFLHDDFEAGEVSRFYRNDLGRCNMFYVGSEVDWNTAITILHVGADGIQVDYVQVFTGREGAKCFFHKYLVDKAQELGSNCTVDKYY